MVENETDNFFLIIYESHSFPEDFHVHAFVSFCLSIGRRFLLLASMPPTTFFLFSIGFAFWAQEQALFGKLTTMITGIVALDSLALYVAFFAIGLVLSYLNSQQHKHHKFLNSYHFLICSNAQSSPIIIKVMGRQ